MKHHIIMPPKVLVAATRQNACHSSKHLTGIQHRHLIIGESQQKQLNVAAIKDTCQHSTMFGITQVRTWFGPNLSSLQLFDWFRPSLSYLRLFKMVRLTCDQIEHALQIFLFHKMTSSMKSLKEVCK
jgi:hypothetical protein